MHLPEAIEKQIKNRDYIPEETGMSGAQVLCCEDLVLKIEPLDRESDNNLAMLRWLSGKLPVPEVVEEVSEDGLRYLLMTRLPGEMSCSEAYLMQPQKLASLLARGLHMLWDVDITACPCSQMLDRKLENARYQVEHELYDLSNVEPDTFGPNGFASPAHLLSWLEKNRPEEECVLSHGDYCLPNVFFHRDNVSGFLDLGRCGVADRYMDIALCYRSLRDNLGGVYGYRDPGFDPCILFEELGITPDWEKIRYYLLMDELF